jgi:hypothetical protein
LFSKREEKDKKEAYEKQRIKRLEEHLSYLRKLYKKEREEDLSFVKVFVAERNLRGHLHNLGSFLLHEERVQWLEEEVKERYGPGCYCVSVQKGNFRSRGVDIRIGGTRKGTATKPKPFSPLSENYEQIGKTLRSAGITLKDVINFYSQQQKQNPNQATKEKSADTTTTEEINAGNETYQKLLSS